MLTNESSLSRMLDLEKEVIVYGATNGLPLGYPLVSPTQLSGLEINAYARELAQVVVWIGYLQRKIDNGFPGNDDPILKPLETIRLQDALLDLSDPDNPQEAVWPAADFIIGNPPFLGSYRMRSELGDSYLHSLFTIYEGRISGMQDLCCYFFEKARAQIDADKTQRAGLLATNSIRGGFNREVLKWIKESGGIFLAWSDEEWILEGAAVRISIVGFDDGTESVHCLDGKSVAEINSDLTGSIDLSSAVRLEENSRICFRAMQKGGPFELSPETANELLSAPLNINGRSNKEVIKPYVTGTDITKRPRNYSIIDVGVSMPFEDAALFEAPFKYALETVKPAKDLNRRDRRREL
jgi:type II restriction/modification system DNA methylase subunit YeeA